MLSIRKLRWISVIGPTAFVVGFEVFTRVLFPDIVPAWVHVVAALAAISAGAFAFSTFVFTSMARLEGQIHERNRRLALLNTIATRASESLDLEQVAATICRNVSNALDAEAAAIALTSEDDGELRLAGHVGLPPGATGPDGALGTYDCDCRKALALDGPVVRDAQELSGCMGVVPNGGSATCVSVPTRSKGKSIGVLLVVRRGRKPFTDDDIDLIVALGSQAGPVLQNAQLFSNTGAIAVLQERQRVAREVHDGLAQTLGYMNVQLGIVDQFLAEGDLESVRGELEAMSQVTRTAYEDLRHSITDLRTPLAVSGGVRRTLREYLEKFSIQTGITCRFDGHTGSAAVLPAESEVQLLRIVQEALNNVRKHAPGAEIWLHVEANSRSVKTVIRDNGPGFDPHKIGREGRYGLHTMKERAEASGGTLRIESRPGAGTTIEVILPTEGVRAA